MEEQQRSIDEIFRQSLGDYREAPPAAAWDKVVARLDDDGTRRRGFFLRWPWIALLLLLIIGGVWFITARYKSDDYTNGSGRPDAPIAGRLESPAIGRQTGPTDTAFNTGTAGASSGDNADHSAAAGSSMENAGAASSASGHTAGSDHRGRNAGGKSMGRHTGQGSARHRRNAGTAHNAGSRARRNTSAINSAARDNANSDKKDGAFSKTDNAGTSGTEALTSSEEASRSARGRGTSGGRSSRTGRRSQNKPATAAVTSPAKAADSRNASADKQSYAAGDRTSAADKPRSSTASRKSLKPSQASSASNRRSAKADEGSLTTNQRSASRRQQKNKALPDTGEAGARQDEPAGSAASGQSVASARSTEQQASANSTAKQKQRERRYAAKAGSTSGNAEATRPKPRAEAADVAAGKLGTEKAAKSAGKNLRPEVAATSRKKSLQSEPATGAAPKPAPEAGSTPKAKKLRTPGAARAVPPASDNVATRPPGRQPKTAAKADRSTKKSSNPSAAKNAPISRTAEKAATNNAAVSAPEKPAVAGNPLAKEAKPVTEPTVGQWHATTEEERAQAENITGSKEKPKLSVTNDADEPAAENEEDDAAEPGKPAGKAGSGGSGGGGSSSGESKRARTSISLAALAGFELGLDKPAPNNVTAAVRMLWWFDPNIAIGIQPAFRYGNMSTTSLSSTAYQRSTPVGVDSVITTDSFGKVNFRSYMVSQTFDSIIVAGLSAGGPMWQIELPIILTYKIAQAWRLYGGASLHFGGKLTSKTGSIETITIQRKDTVNSPSGTVQPARSLASFENHFGISSLPNFSTYTPGSEAIQDPSSLRFGYLFGVGYERKRINFDLSLHQQVSGARPVANPFRNVYTSPYVRMSIGYTLFPQKNARKKTEE